MKARHLMLACLLLGGCAGLRQEPATIGSLPKRPASVETGQDRVEGSRERAMDIYRRFLDEAPSSAMHAEALRRLADLSLEQHEALAGGEPGTEPASPDAGMIIALYERRLREYPDHPRNDRVLYQLARAYEQDGQREASLDTLTRLAHRHPDSPLVAETHFRRGETLFVDRDYVSAAQAYEAVLAQGERSGFHEQSLYKLGWSLFRQQRHEDSVDAFMTLLDLKLVDGRTQPERLSGGERERIEDALRAVSLNFGYMGGPESATRYFSERGHRADEDLIYARLAEEYLEKERYSDAAASYGAFVAAHPLREQAPAMQLRVIETYRQGGFSGEVLAAKETFAALFDLDGPFWHERDTADHPDVVEALAGNLGRLARHYHASYQEEPGAAHFASAERWYQRYLANFPEAPDSQEMRFLYAELLFEDRRFDAAAREYEQVAYLYTPDERASEAGYAALLAYDAHEETLTDRNALDAWERQSLDSARRFASAFPEHPQAVAVLSRAIDRLFRLNETQAASDSARQLLERYPDAAPEPRLGAWLVIGHVAFDEGDFLDAEMAYQQALASPVLDAQQRPDLHDRMAASIYRQGEAAREADDADSAVAHFLRVPDSRFRATARYDAADLLFSRSEWLPAAQVLEEFRQTYPDHPLGIDASRKLAVAYAEAAQPERAAGEFLHIAGASEDEAERREAMLRAAELYGASGDGVREAGVLREYVERFPQPLEPAMEVRQRLVDLHLARGDHAQARQWRQAIIRADAGAGSARSERSRYLAGTASMADAEERLAAYRAVRLEHPLERNLQRKRQLMDEALQAFGRAGEYQVASVTTAATYYTGEVYADFGRALMESERPRDLDALALEEYELLLEEQAYPFEEKAIELFEINAARARQGLYDDWVRKSFDRLSTLMPVRYAKRERSEDLVDTLR